MEGCCERETQISVSTKGGQRFDQMSNYAVLKNSASRIRY